MLSCFSNRLTDLDVGNNPALETLSCDFNRLTRLDVRQNPALTDLSCAGNQLTDLDLSQNGKLLFLECYGNAIKSLDLSNCGDILKRVLQNDPELSVLEDLVWMEAEDLYSLYYDCETTLTVDGRTIREGAPAKTSVLRCNYSVRDKTWTGKPLEPAVTVTDGDRTLVKGVDYTVSYADNRDVGIAVATVEGKGNYTESVNVTFRIKPRGTTLSKLTGGRKKITVKWRKQTKQVSGYQIQYGTQKDFSDAGRLTVKGAKSDKATLEKLKARKTYYVRIRTYKKVDGHRIYSAWSKTGTVKTR